MNKQHFAVIATQRAESAYYSHTRQGAPLRGWTPITISGEKGGVAVIVKISKSRKEAEKIALDVAFYAGVETGQFGHTKMRAPAVKIVKVSHLQSTKRGYRIAE